MFYWAVIGVKGKLTGNEWNWYEVGETRHNCLNIICYQRYCLTYTAHLAWAQQMHALIITNN